jgi:hypothetical protein
MSESQCYIIAICDEKDKPVFYLEAMYHVDIMPISTTSISKADLYYTKLNAEAHCSLLKAKNPHINFKTKSVTVRITAKVKLDN